MKRWVRRRNSFEWGAGSTPAASSRLLASGFTAVLLLIVAPAAAPGQDSATLTWQGQSHPVAMAGKDFRVTDVASALGFSVSADAAADVLTLAGYGHTVTVGAGTARVPVDQRIVAISRPARVVAGALYAPADFLEKVLFPLVGANGTWDASQRVWSVAAGDASPISLEVAVVHVDPTTQVVLHASAAARFLPTLSEKGFQIRWTDRRIAPPFPERSYEDPLVAAIRFAGDMASIDFREPGLSARAYPLTGPDRIVVEVSRPVVAPAAPAVAPSVAPPPGLTIVIDPGHGGSETGAVGLGGLAEKEITLQIARRLAATIPAVVPSRVLLTRDSDSAISLDDRTAVANHERADLFLSLHANSSRAPGAHGTETYYLSLEASDKLAQEVASRENAAGGAPAAGTIASGNPDLDFILWDLAQSAHIKESSELAEAIQEELNEVSRTENRGIKQAPFRVLVAAAMPAVLVEIAFISNPDEEKKLRSPAFQQGVADAIARAIGRFVARRRPDAMRPRPAATPTPGP